MIFFVNLFLLCFYLTSYSQTKVKVYQEQIENGIKILADNDELCPVSAEITLSSQALKTI